MLHRLGAGRVQRDVPLAPMTTFRIGGPADFLVRARTADELAAAVTAARELEEETGYRASRIESLGWFYTSPGFADERMHVFLATGLVPVPQRLEPGEELEVVVMDEPSLREAIVRREVVDGKTLRA